MVFYSRNVTFYGISTALVGPLKRPSEPEEKAWKPQQRCGSLLTDSVIPSGTQKLCWPDAKSLKWLRVNKETHKTITAFGPPVLKAHQSPAIRADIPELYSQDTAPRKPKGCSPHPVISEIGSADGENPCIRFPPMLVHPCPLSRIYHLWT